MKLIYFKISLKYQMVIFQYVAVYKYHKRLFKSIQKQKKMQHSTQPTHSTFTQSVHFPQASVHC